MSVSKYCKYRPTILNVRACHRCMKPVLSFDNLPSLMTCPSTTDCLGLTFLGKLLEFGPCSWGLHFPTS